MDAQQWSVLSRLFDSLIDLPSSEREAALARLREEQPALAGRLASMLAADADADDDGVLDRPISERVPDLAGDESARDGHATTGQLFGRYRVLELIGSGGMGEVWRAERADGEYSQDVALKLLKRGMDTEAVLRRFRQERSILARLAHPAIVRLLDGGMTADGRPYFVMERVDGLPATRHAAQHGLDLRARVRLVAAVADAIGVAHAQLIVHRDIKPANVLVDAQGQPHLLDFGIAKVLEDTGEDTLTGTGTRLLSPAYAAPEQILGQPVGTATDIYAMGVLLFELLTGRLPHKRGSRDPSVLASALSGETGERASHAVITGDLTRLSVAFGRDTDPRQLARDIAGDLDVVLAKALHPEPGRRYATAAAFADDLRRWLDRRPIMARPDSPGYRFGKFVRRHRLGVAAAALVLLALVGGFGVAVWQAKIARVAAERARVAEADAQRQARIATSVTEFLMRDVIQAANPFEGTPDIRLTDALIQAGERVDQRFVDNPYLSGVVHRELAKSLRLAGVPDVAAIHAEKAIETLRVSAPAGDLELQAARLILGRFRHVADDFEGAEALYRDGLAELGDDPAPEAVLPFHIALAGLDVERRREVGAAERLRALEPEVQATFGDFSDPHLDLLDHWMRAYSQLDRFQDTLDLARRARIGAQARYGEDHPATLKWLQREGVVLSQLERFQEALALTESICARSEAALGAEHDGSHDCRLRQGVNLYRLGRAEEAGELFQRVVAFRERTSGADASDTWLGWIWLARAWQQQGRLNEARALFEKAQDTALRVLGPDDPNALPFRQTLGMFLQQTGQLDDAHALRMDLLARSQRILPGHIFTVKYAWDVAETLASARRDAELIAFCQEWLSHWERDFPANDSRLTDVRAWLETARERRGLND